MSVQRVIWIWQFSVAVLVIITFGVTGYLTAIYPDGATRPLWVEALKGLLSGICILPWSLAFLGGPIMLKARLSASGTYMARVVISVAMGLVVLVAAVYLIVEGMVFFSNSTFPTSR